MTGSIMEGRLYKNDYYIFQDETRTQIKYYVGPKCYNTWCNVKTCRCIFCITLHTARLPDVDKLEESQHIAVLCHMESDLKGPVFRHGVSSEENRAEFRV